MTNLPPKTPMDPVMVAGSATIAAAGAATKYPPDAATPAIETTSGLPFSLARLTSRQIASAAT